MVQKRSKFNRYLKQVIFSVFGFLAASEAAFSDEIKVNIFVPVDSYNVSYDYLHSGSLPIFDEQIEIAKQAVMDCGKLCEDIDEIEVRYVPHSLGSIRGQQVWPIPGAVQPTPWMDLEVKEDGKKRLYLLASDVRFLTDLWTVNTRPSISTITVDSYSLSDACFALLVDSFHDHNQDQRGQALLPNDFLECIPYSFAEPLESFLSMPTRTGEKHLPSEFPYEYYENMRKSTDVVGAFYKNLYPEMLKFLVEKDIVEYHLDFRTFRVRDQMNRPYWRM